MNLLPFVVIIVLILGMFSFSQFQRINSIDKEKSTYIAYFKGLRETRNDAEDSMYAKSKKSPSSESVGSSPSTKSKEKEKDDVKDRPFFRDRKIGWPSGRLNLSSLLEDVPKYKGLKDYATSYLIALYGETDFFPKDPKHFLDHLIAVIKSSEDMPLLQELDLGDPQLQETLYKMLRGTHTYDLNGRGYPPFEHFFTFEKNNAAPMNFHSANTTFLYVVMGADATNQLVTQEKELIDSNALNSPIKTAEEVKLVLKDKFSQVADLFDFSSPTNTRNPEMYVDDQTKITVRIE